MKVISPQVACKHLLSFSLSNLTSMLEHFGLEYSDIKEADEYLSIPCHLGKDPFSFNCNKLRRY